MVNIIGIVIVTFIVTFLGGGGGYLIWLWTRPKNITWNANVWQLSRGVVDTGKITLQDLKPYRKDVLEKVEKDKGIVIFRLQRLNSPTPAVEDDVVDFWGNGQQEVNVLKVKEGYTLLKKGYDKERGEIVFDPLPHSRVNLIRSEIALRKDRLQKEKDILQAISPFVVAGIVMLGLVTIAYVMISGFIEISENNGGSCDGGGGGGSEPSNVEGPPQTAEVPEPNSVGAQPPPSIE